METFVTCFGISLLSRILPMSLIILLSFINKNILFVSEVLFLKLAFYNNNQ